MSPRSLLVLIALSPVLGLGCGGSGSGGGGGGQAGAGGSSTGGTGTGASGAGGIGGVGGTGVGGSGGTGAAGIGGTGPQCEGIFQLCCDEQGNSQSQICQNGVLSCPPGTQWQQGGPGTACPQPGQCTATKPCAADQYCDFSDNLCGSGMFGDCKPKPQTCDTSYAPVCTCNGTVESNECSAYAKGSDLNANGGCVPPNGMFSCGTIFCSTTKDYCLVMLSDVGSVPDSFECKALPAGCAPTPSCACLASEPCGAQCQDNGGNLTLTCSGA